VLTKEGKMPIRRTRAHLPPPARVFSRLDADDVLLPREASALRKSSALTLAVLMLCAVPLFWAANAAGLIGDVPTAVAKGKDGGLESDDDRLGPGDVDDDERTFLRTDQTSRDNKSTRGTTDDNDTRTKMGTDSTSGNGKSTRGTTKDNDTRTKMGTDDTSGNNSTRGTTNDNDTYTVTGTDTGTQTGAASVTGTGGGAGTGTGGGTDT
jgi:hypothetical protein